MIDTRAPAPTNARLGILASRNRRAVALRLFLAAAALSFIASVVCWFLVDRDVGLFVGLWVPSILSVAILLIQDFRT
jgi:hypothetical protein